MANSIMICNEAKTFLAKFFMLRNLEGSFVVDVRRQTLFIDVYFTY